MIENLLYVILAVFGLGILIFIHELGHYFMARRVGMRVEAFGIGFGKPIYSWEHKGVKWNICSLPFGGYVRIAGMEKEGNLEPHQITDGYFGKRPIDRIKVALAGPIVNLVFAFLAFSLLWAIGGREKPFSDFTHLIGWVDPQSQLYKENLRAGDVIDQANNRSFKGFKDLLYAAVLDDKCIDIKGTEIDYFTQQKKPFNVTFDASQGVQLVDRSVMPYGGILSPASYLIYDKVPGQESSLPSDSPMGQSGIQFGDRIIWADGQLLFSKRQLGEVINESKSLLTVVRDNKAFITRAPRLKVGDLRLNTIQKAELDDWQHAAGLKTKVSQLFFIPYGLSTDCTVEKTLVYMDESSEEHIPAAMPRSPLDIPLQKGDRIVAVDGAKVSTSVELLGRLQTKQVQIIVDRSPKIPNLSWKDADQYFTSEINWKDLQKISQSIGTDQVVQESGKLVLLAPVVPKPFANLSLSADKKAWMTAESNMQKKEIEEIEDPEKKAALLQSIEDTQHRLMLGIPLQDRQVVYNPAPWTLFFGVFDEIRRTLSALFTGYLSPKGMAGPVGIVQVMHYSWMVGIKEAIYWMAAISLNLGILNLLPIPVLDGGHICFALYESLTKKKIKAKTMERLIIPFVVLLVGIFIYLTYQDLTRLVTQLFNK